MKARCYNKAYPLFHDYGGRGITVCDRWRNSFESFYADMGPKPTPKHSIERIDNEKGYSPDNCKWATATEQQSNTRRNVKLTIGGRTQTVAAWAREANIKDKTVYLRLKLGWDAASAVFSPLRVNQYSTRVPPTIPAERACSTSTS